MAVFTVANGGGNINAGATYVGGVAPTSSDTIDFTSTSGQLTVNVNFTIAGIDFTNYVNTITFVGNLTVNGNITLASGMSFAGASTLGFICNETATLTSNGVTLPNNLSLIGISKTYTFADTWTVAAFSNANPHTLNGSSVEVQGNFVCAQEIIGTTIINLIGTGTWSSSGRVGNKLNINTSGTITVNGTVSASDLTYVSGTVVTTGSTLSCANSSATWDTSAIIWNNVTLGAGVITLTSDLNMSGTLTMAAANFVTIVTSNINCSGSISLPNQSVSGSITINLTGTGTWSGTGQIKTNLNINTVGTITIAGTVAFNTGTLTYTSGTVVTTGSQLNVTASATLDISGINLNKIVFGGTITVTLLSDLNVYGLWQVSNPLTLNGFNINIYGSITIFSSSQGTTVVNALGTGTYNINVIYNNMNINTAGTITFLSGSNFYYGVNTLTYIAGTVITTNHTLSIQSSCTLNTSGITWNNVSNFATGIVTLTSNLNLSGTFRTQTATGTLNGFNVNCSGNLLVDSGNNTTSGTTLVNLTGTGTWSGSGIFRNILTIKTGANITINGLVNYNTGTLTVEPDAVVNTGGSTIQIGATVTTTFDIGNIKLFNIILGGFSTVPILQLNSPLYITGTATLGGSSQTATINGSPIYIESGRLTSGPGNGGWILGTSQIIATGDRFTYLDSETSVNNGQGVWRIPITVNASYFLMTGRLVLSTGGNLTINSNRVENLANFRNLPGLIVQASMSLINVHKCKFKNITITAGVTLTMNEFFTGSPEFKSIIRSTSTANYTVTFTDRVPKKSFHVNVRNCNVTQTLVRNQLNIINRDGNAGFNTGIIFGESGMCGFPLNKFPTEVSYPTDNGFKNGLN
jgi:hypothetical protein